MLCTIQTNEDDGGGYHYDLNILGTDRIHALAALSFRLILGGARVKF